MTRMLVLVSALALLATPVLADGADDAVSACAKELSRTYGVAKSVTAGLKVGGGGQRFELSGYAEYNGTKQRVSCKTNKGRVTAVVWG